MVSFFNVELFVAGWTEGNQLSPAAQRTIFVGAVRILNLRKRRQLRHNYNNKNNNVPYYIIILIYDTYRPLRI